MYLTVQVELTSYGLTEKYTVEEMRAHIEAWKKKGVK